MATDFALLRMSVQGWAVPCILLTLSVLSATAIPKRARLLRRARFDMPSQGHGAVKGSGERWNLEHSREEIR